MEYRASSLTTNIDVATAQYFDGSLNTFGQQTLQNFDELTGQKTFNVLDAEIVQNVTPAVLDNIQLVEITNLNTTGSGNTVSLLNADSVEAVVNDGSLNNLTFSNVGDTLQAVGVANLLTAQNTTVTFSSTAAVAELDLAFENVAGGTVTIANVETVNVFSEVEDSTATLALADATALTFAGDANLDATLDATTNGVSSVDASSMDGDLNLTFVAQTQVLSTTDISVVGGNGDDTFTVSALTQDYTITLGAGNDTVVDTAIGNNDSIEGGEGVDTLSTTYVQAAALTTANGVNGIDVLELSTALNGTLTTATVDSTIDTLSVAVAGALTAAASTVTGSAGEFTVNLGTSGAGNTGALANGLTVTDTGTGTNDILNINNVAVNSTNNTNVNVFAAQNVTSTGYENVTISTGDASPTAQTIGTLTITADSTSAPVSLTVDGSSALQVTSLSTNSTGLTTVDASGMNVLSTAAGLTVSGTTLSTIGSATGTQSLIGSAGADNINVGNWASTIIGGTGNDTLEGGTLADSIDGGEGADSITGAGGNDTLHGGAGGDTIVSTVAGVVSITGGEGNDSVNLALTLASTDTVDGGTGVDTLVVTTANITAADAIGVTNFEILNTSGDQSMTNFYNNSGWTTVLMNGAGVDITNALAAVATLQVNTSATGTQTFDRLVDTGTDTLTFATTGTAADLSMTALQVADEETLTIDVSNGDAGAMDLTIGTLTATDLTSLTLTGDNSVIITNAIVGATGLATVNASGLTAALDIDATNSTSDLTFTGSTANANTFVSGSGDDNLTGGSAADSIVGNAGNDTVNLGAGADTYVFANTGTANATATVAQVVANVGTDSIDGYIVGTDALQVSIAAFGTNIGAVGALNAAQYAEAVSTTALLGALTNEGIVVIQAAADADASIYCVSGSVAAGAQSITSLLQSGNATLIASLTSVSGDISVSDFSII